MKRLLLLLPVLAVLLCGCNGPTVEPQPGDDSGKTGKHAIRTFELTDAEQQMNVQTNTFALNMLRQIVGSEDLAQTPNICFSPVSANMALGILLGGADGQTRAQMQTVLGFADATEQQVNDYYHKLVEALPYLDSTTVVKIANALWLKQTFPIKDAYRSQTQATFNATIDNVRTFVDDAVIDMINQWAADNTNNLIRKVIDRSMVSDDLMMVFANALYFKGIWDKKFEERSTIRENFTTAAGKTEKRDMMTHYFSNARYTETDAAQVLELAYEGDKYCMDILLPKSGKQPADVLDDLTPERWVEIEKNVRWGSYDVDVWLPKFKYTYERSLIRDLQTLGIQAAFTPMADFSKLSEVDTYLGFLKQVCYIAVDEQGTEAAAVTIGGNYTTSVGPEPQPKIFHATHPFVYIIRERQYGTILFCGVVGDPS